MRHIIVHMEQLNLMTSADVAVSLGVHKRTVYRMVRDGRLEAMQVPGYNGPYIFDRADIERFISTSARSRRIQAQEVEPTT